MPDTRPTRPKIDEPHAEDDRQGPRDWITCADGEGADEHEGAGRHAGTGPERDECDASGSDLAAEQLVHGQQRGHEEQQAEQLQGEVGAHIREQQQHPEDQAHDALGKHDPPGRSPFPWSTFVHRACGER